MEKEIKRCPFRKTADGEFAECYGAECMAYLEYDATPYTVFSKGGEQQESQHITMCHMMPMPGFGGGCAV